MAVQTSLHVACYPDGFVVRVVGRGTLKHAPMFRELAGRCVVEGKTVLAAMEQCDFLDSTFLGSLVALHKQCRGGCGQFAVIADPMVQQRLFMPTMMHRVLSFRECYPDGLSDFLELPHESCAASRLGEVMLCAHQQLADLGGPDASRFQAIADRLRAELRDHGHSD